MRLIVREFLISETRRIAVYSDTEIHPGQRGYVVLREQRKNKLNKWQRLTGGSLHTEKTKAIEEGEKSQKFYEAHPDSWLRPADLALGAK